MKALIITDTDDTTGGYSVLCGLITHILAKHGYETDIRSIGRNVKPCIGCFGCWIRTPGECVIRDEMAVLNRIYVNSDIVVFVSPIVYGQFSANMKNVLDRTLPRLLPFFYHRPDGTTMHPQRYGQSPVQFIVGYGTGLTDEEQNLFRDITVRHRTDVHIVIWQNDSDTEKITAIFGRFLSDTQQVQNREKDSSETDRPD